MGMTETANTLCGNEAIPICDCRVGTAMDVS